MVDSTRAPSQNSSSRYPTIRGSEASDARTPNRGVDQNLSPAFNTVMLQTILESIHRMVPQDSPLVSLTQQGAEAVGRAIRWESILRLGEARLK
jgi:hypothetical protein